MFVAGPIKLDSDYEPLNSQAEAEPAVAWKAAALTDEYAGSGLVYYGSGCTAPSVVHAFTDRQINSKTIGDTFDYFPHNRVRELLDTVGWTHVPLRTSECAPAHTPSLFDVAFRKPGCTVRRCTLCNVRA